MKYAALCQTKQNMKLQTESIAQESHLAHCKQALSESLNLCVGGSFKLMHVLFHYLLDVLVKFNLCVGVDDLNSGFTCTYSSPSIFRRLLFA